MGSEQKVKSMEKARALKALGIVHPELADLLLTLEKDLLELIDLKDERDTLQAQLREAQERVRDLERENAELLDGWHQGIIQKEVNMLPETEAAVRIAELEAELASVDRALNAATMCQAKTRADRIKDTLEHEKLASDAAIFDAEKREHSWRAQVVLWMGEARELSRRIVELEAEHDTSDAEENE